MAPRGSGRRIGNHSVVSAGDNGSLGKDGGGGIDEAGSLGGDVGSGMDKVVASSGRCVGGTWLVLRLVLGLAPSPRSTSGRLEFRAFDPWSAVESACDLPALGTPDGGRSGRPSRFDLAPAATLLGLGEDVQAQESGPASASAWRVLVEELAGGLVRDATTGALALIYRGQRYPLRALEFTAPLSPTIHGP
jgi:hypothetical protein